jgi:hypothetical protein
MAYNNPILDFADRNPMIGFFIAPVVIYYGGVLTAAVIRKQKTGSAWLGGDLFDPRPQESGLAGAIRTEGGSPDDLMFRATASNAQTKRVTAVGDEIQSRTQGGPIRYDRNYHDSIFFPNLDYKDNKEIITQSYSPSVTDSYVFAGIGGMNKLR